MYDLLGQIAPSMILGAEERCIEPRHEMVLTFVKETIIVKCDSLRDIVSR